MPKTEAEISWKSYVSAYEIELYKNLEYNNQKRHNYENIISYNKNVL